MEEGQEELGTGHRGRFWIVDRRLQIGDVRCEIRKLRNLGGQI